MARFRRLHIGSLTVLGALDFFCLITFLVVLLAVLYRHGVLGTN